MHVFEGDYTKAFLAPFLCLLGWCKSHAEVRQKTSLGSPWLHKSHLKGTYVSHFISFHLLTLSSLQKLNVYPTSASAAILKQKFPLLEIPLCWKVLLKARTVWEKQGYYYIFCIGHGKTEKCIDYWTHTWIYWRGLKECKSRPQKSWRKAGGKSEKSPWQQRFHGGCYYCVADILL